MSQIPESTHSSSHWTIGLRSAESDGTRGRLCRPPGFPSASPPQWLVSGPRTSGGLLQLLAALPSTVALPLQVSLKLKSRHSFSLSLQPVLPRAHPVLELRNSPGSYLKLHLSYPARPDKSDYHTGLLKAGGLAPFHSLPEHHQHSMI